MSLRASFRPRLRQPAVLPERSAEDAKSQGDDVSTSPAARATLHAKGFGRREDFSDRGLFRQAMTTAHPIRIAMWSGPRNISTAMMRSFENRGDCAVVDEPFYAHYLEHTQLDHPGRDEVIAAGQTD